MRALKGRGETAARGGRKEYVKIGTLDAYLVID